MRASFAVGFFDAGTNPGLTTFNVWDIVFGKTLPKSNGAARLFWGAYIGNKILGKNRGGFMVGYIHGFCKRKYCDGTEYHEWSLLADYASGKNTQGGGGAGLMYSPTPNINFIFGPTFFNGDPRLGRWKWTIQFDMVILFASPMSRCHPTPNTI